MRALLARMVMVVGLIAGFTLGLTGTATAASGTAAVNWANAHNGEVYGTAAEQPEAPHQWSGYCWTFVYDAFAGAVPREDNAQKAWDYYAGKGMTHTGAPPAGTIAFWSDGTEGHAAVAIGGGMTVGTHGASWDRFAVETVAYNNRELTYLGWVDPNGGGSSATGFAVAVQANTGDLYTYTSDGSSRHVTLGMMSGTSPSITTLADGRYAVAVQANTGDLYTYTSDGGSAHITIGMMSGTSPAITAYNGGYAVAVQANTGDLYTYTPDGSSRHVTLGMMSGTSPSITLY